MLGGTMMSLRDGDSSGLEMVVVLEVLGYNLRGDEMGRMGLEEYWFHEGMIS